MKPEDAPGPYFLARHIPWTECGCEPRVSLDEGTYGATRIVYCRLHDAAPEMLKELEAFLIGMDAYINVERNEEDTLGALEDRAASARALLAKIEGKS